MITVLAVIGGFVVVVMTGACIVLLAGVAWLKITGQL